MELWERGRRANEIRSHRFSWDSPPLDRKPQRRSAFIPSSPPHTFTFSTRPSVAPLHRTQPSRPFSTERACRHHVNSVLPKLVRTALFPHLDLSWPRAGWPIAVCTHCALRTFRPESDIVLFHRMVEPRHIQNSYIFSIVVISLVVFAWLAGSCVRNNACLCSTGRVRWRISMHL
jgi:hypothetical protein